MSNDKFDCLKLENQLCFPLYVCSKEIIRNYTPILKKFDLTYTQYIAMLVLWEKSTLTVKELGEILYLDSGTLTPLLKKLEKKGYITRTRSQEDEREVLVNITDEGKCLKEQVVNVPEQISKCVNLNKEDAINLYNILTKLMRKHD